MANTQKKFILSLDISIHIVVFLSLIQPLSKRSSSESALTRIGRFENGSIKRRKKSMKKWQCTVCNYIHKGDEPPDECPVCGSDKSYFVEYVEEAKTNDAPEAKDAPKADQTESQLASKSDKPEVSTETASKTIGQAVVEQMLKHHVHTISVHIPNGVLPVAVLFAILAALCDTPGFQTVAKYNMIFVVLTLPAVLFTGYIEWKKRYKGALTTRFVQKITSAAVVSVTSVIIVIWWLVNPGVLDASLPVKSIFLLLHFIALAAAGYAGLIGGKFVFKD